MNSPEQFSSFVFPYWYSLSVTSAGSVKKVFNVEFGWSSSVLFVSLLRPGSKFSLAQHDWQYSGDSVAWK